MKKPVPKARSVFVSYSRADVQLVTPIVETIRATGGTAFQDIDSIPPGKRWRAHIRSMIDQASMVIVFWCAHSNLSREVTSEWHIALEADKDIAPALLDNTPLTPALAAYQALDLRSLVKSSHRNPLERRVGPDLWGAPHEEILTTFDCARVASRIISFLEDRP
jgi:hypothetical protein